MTFGKGGIKIAPMVERVVVVEGKQLATSQLTIKLTDLIAEADRRGMELDITKVYEYISRPNIKVQLKLVPDPTSFLLIMFQIKPELRQRLER